MNPVRPIRFDTGNLLADPIKHKRFTFPGGEPHFQIEEDLHGETVIIEAHLQYPADFMDIPVLKDAVERSGADKIVLYLPYFPGARQDRVEVPGTPFTALVYAELVNFLNFDQVIIVDPHSDVTPALVESCTVVPQTETFTMMYTDFESRKTIWAADRAVLVAPDAGSVKKTEKIADQFGYEVVYARKHRDPKTGKLSHFSCDPIPKGKRAIVVDDICDGGGTFLGLGAAIARDQTHEIRNGLDKLVFSDPYWENLQLVVTHGIFSNRANLVELDRVYRGGIFTSDSFSDAYYDPFPNVTRITDKVLARHLAV